MALDFGKGGLFSNDFLSSEESFWSSGGAQFVSSDFTDIQPTAEGHLQVNSNNTLCSCVAVLPQGATVTSVACYGSESDESFTLRRTKITDGTDSQSMGGANLNIRTEDITYTQVDNSQYMYRFLIDSSTTRHALMITYTTDYI